MYAKHAKRCPRAVAAASPSFGSGGGNPTAAASTSFGSGGGNDSDGDLGGDCGEGHDEPPPVMPPALPPAHVAPVGLPMQHYNTAADAAEAVARAGLPHGTELNPVERLCCCRHL